MVSEFLQDREGRVWLVRTSACKVAADGPAVRAGEVDFERLKRTSSAPAIGDALSVPAGLEVPTSRDDNMTRGGQPLGGARSEQRLAR